MLSMWEFFSTVCGIMMIFHVENLLIACLRIWCKSEPLTLWKKTGNVLKICHGMTYCIYYKQLQDIDHKFLCYNDNCYIFLVVTSRLDCLLDSCFCVLHWSMDFWQCLLQQYSAHFCMKVKDFFDGVWKNHHFYFVIILANINYRGYAIENNVLSCHSC